MDEIAKLGMDASELSKYVAGGVLGLLFLGILHASALISLWIQTNAKQKDHDERLATLEADHKKCLEERANDRGLLNESFDSDPSRIYPLIESMRRAQLLK